MRYNINLPDAVLRLVPNSWRSFFPKATSDFTLFCQSIIQGIIYIQNRFLSFVYSSYTIQGNQWKTGTTYSIGSIVTFNLNVYINVTGQFTTSNPYIDKTNWSLYLNNFIGVYDRVRYNGSVLSLTFALNKQFGGTFVQPNGVLPYNLSSIYISTDVEYSDNYSISLSGNVSSFQGLNNSVFNYLGTPRVSDIVGVSLSGKASNNVDLFAIHVPIAIYIAVTGQVVVAGQTNPTGYQIFINFVEQFSFAGFIISVVTY